MIIANAVTYEYPSIRALTEVSFEVDAGAIVALIGPNGAGKTTLLRCLAALERPYSGDIAIDGISTTADPRGVHRKIGYLSDFFGVYEDLTLRQCLHYAARAGGVPSSEVDAAIDRAAQQVELSDRLDSVAGTLSRGLRQRLGIGQALIHQPSVLLLDEPASGLDPEARHSLSQLFTTLRDQGITLMVSSHILSELEDYATEVIFIRDGRLVQQGPVGGTDAETVRLRIDLSEPSPALAVVLAGSEGIQIEAVSESEAVIRIDRDPHARQALLHRLVGDGLAVCGFAVEKEGLQESYLSFVDDLEKGGV
ncbi:MAG: ABC transporter ATP-binding protein [Alphaproteobacteria bacterium]